MNQNRYQVQYEKDKLYLKAFLHGRNYHVALKALGFIERETAGKFRKDGVMPEMHHMVRLALDAIQLGIQYNPNKFLSPKILSLEEQLITTLLYHDILEDDTTGKIDQELIKHKSNIKISDSVWLMTKKFRGQKKDKKEYINEVGENLISALGKGIDRNDNLENMIGVFNLEKITIYTHEAKTEHYPMLKRASKLFPEHMREFQVVMYRMKRNISFIEKYMSIVEKHVSEVQEIKLNTAQSSMMITPVDAVKKILNIFDDVSPEHFLFLKGKLCMEFGISRRELET